jgi:hypothetical protein
MNKSELTQQAKFDDKTLDAILEALGIPKNLPDYTNEHLKLVQAIKDIHKNEGCKSWAEAVGIYRKLLNEAQLQEIALRRAIAHERIPEILAAMKLKPETLTDKQIEVFGEVCQMLQSGMALEIASQAATNNAKAQATAKATPEPAQASAEAKQTPNQSTAIAPAKGKPMPGLAVQAIPNGHDETLQSVVDVAIDTAGFDVNGRIADKALDASEALDGAIDNAIWRSLMDPSRANALSAEKVVAAINHKREERKHG